MTKLYTEREVAALLAAQDGKPAAKRGDWKADVANLDAYLTRKLGHETMARLTEVWQEMKADGITCGMNDKQELLPAGSRAFGDVFKIRAYATATPTSEAEAALVIQPTPEGNKVVKDARATRKAKAPSTETAKQVVNETMPAPNDMIAAILSGIKAELPTLVRDEVSAAMDAITSPVEASRENL